MKCLIGNASPHDRNVRPCDNAYWDEKLKSWCVNIESMEHFKTILSSINPDICTNSISEVIVSLRPIDKMLSITIYDDFIE